MLFFKKEPLYSLIFQFTLKRFRMNYHSALPSNLILVVGFLLAVASEHNYFCSTLT